MRDRLACATIASTTSAATRATVIVDVLLFSFMPGLPTHVLGVTVVGAAKPPPDNNFCSGIWRRTTLRRVRAGQRAGHSRTVRPGSGFGPACGLASAVVNGQPGETAAGATTQAGETAAAGATTQAGETAAAGET